MEHFPRIIVTKTNVMLEILYRKRTCCHVHDNFAQFTFHFQTTLFRKLILKCCTNWNALEYNFLVSPFQFDWMSLRVMQLKRLATESIAQWRPQDSITQLHGQQLFRLHLPASSPSAVEWKNTGSCHTGYSTIASTAQYTIIIISIPSLES